MLFRFLIISIFLAAKMIANDAVLRSKPISDLIDLLSNNNFITVYGLSGMGKTIVAKQISHNLKDDFFIVWFNWQEGNIDQEIEEFLSKNNHKIKSKGDIYKKLFSILSGQKNTLVIVDNYTESDISTLKEKFHIPENSSVKWVMTARHRVKESNNYSIPPMTNNEGIMLIKSIIPNATQFEMKKLLSLLGNYPYFISACSNLAKTSPSLNLTGLIKNLDNGSVVNIIHQYTKDRSDQKGFNVVKNQLEKMSKEMPDTFLLLSFMSCINSKNIPLSLLEDFIVNKDKLNESIGYLHDQGFIYKVNKDSAIINYDIHDLTQDIVKEIIDVNYRDKLIKYAVEAFIDNFSKSFKDIILNHEEEKSFFFHIDSFIKNNSDYTKEMLPLRVLSLKRGLYSRRKGQNSFKEASKLWKDCESYEIEKVLPEKILFEYYLDSSFLYSYHHISDEKQSKMGIIFSQKAIDIALKNNDKINQFRAYTRAGWILLYVGKTDDCKSSLDKAYKLLSVNNDSYDLKEYYFASSWYYMEVGDFQNCYIEAEKGVHFDDISKSANIGLYLRMNFAYSAWRLGKDPIKIEGYIKEALEKENYSFGDESSLARAELLQVKALLAKDANNLDSALSIIEESLALFKRLRNGDPYTPNAFSHSICAQILLAKGDLKYAHKHALLSVKEFSGLVDSVTYEFAEAYATLAFILAKQNNYEEFKETLRILESKCKKSHPALKKLYKDLNDAKLFWLIT